MAGVVGFAVGCEAQPVENAARAELVGVTSSALTENAITRESFDNQGRQGNGASVTPSISPNGRYVAFQSESTVWASAIDTNGFVPQIYLKDRWVGSITLVSQVRGVVANGASLNASVADDGSVAFVTNATNLAPNATDPFAKVLVWQNGTIVRADVARSGEANGPSSYPQISGDGSSVIFQSLADNLVAGDTNEAEDVFVSTGFATGAPSIRLVSITQSGAPTNGSSYYGTIDYSGQVVAFASDASNIVFNDGNDATDVFAAELQSGSVRPVSFATTGFGGSVGNARSSLPQISGDGSTVVFLSFATNFQGGDPNAYGNIYVNPVESGRSPIPVGVTSSGGFANGPSWQSAISYNGSVVAFVSAATNLIDAGAPPGPPGGAAAVFVRDLIEGQTVQVDVGIAGLPLGGGALINSSIQFSGSPSIPSPSFLVFDSASANLGWGDTNGLPDVFTASLSL